MSVKSVYLRMCGIGCCGEGRVVLVLRFIRGMTELCVCGALVYVNVCISVGNGEGCVCVSGV